MFMGIALRLARQCQNNGWVKYQLKIVHETRILWTVAEMLLIQQKTPNKQIKVRYVFVYEEYKYTKKKTWVEIIK